MARQYLLLKQYMYLIKKIHFDNWEKKIELAKQTENVGIVDGDEAAALRWMEENRLALGTKYKGWDNNEYPYYEKEYVKELKVKKD